MDKSGIRIDHPAQSRALLVVLVLLLVPWLAGCVAPVAIDTPHIDAAADPEPVGTHDDDAEGTPSPARVPVTDEVSPKQGKEAPGPVTLGALMSLARENNPTLIQADAQVAGYVGKAVQAGLYPNPTVGYTGEQIGVSTMSDDNSPGEFHGVFIRQEIVTANKLDLSRGEYEARTAASKFQTQAQALRVFNAVRIHYYQTLAAEQRLEVQQELLKTAQDNLLTVRESFGVGQANRAEVLQARVVLQEQNLAVEAAQNDLRMEWETLTATVGVDLPFEALAGELEGEADAIEWEATLARLLEESPELAVARANLKADRIALEREQVEPIPNVFVQAGVGHNFVTDEAVANASVFFELPVFDQNQGAILQAKADLQRQQAQVHATELRLRRTLATQYQRYRTALQHVKDFQDAILPQSQRRYVVELESYRVDRENWEEVLRTQRDYFELRMIYIDHLLNWRTAQIAIKGLLLINGLQSPGGVVPPGHIEVQRFAG